MSLGGSGGGRKRNKKSSKDARADNAKKQSLWRRRHPDKYEAFKERLRMQTMLNRGQRKPGGYLIYDLCDVDGTVVDVVVRAHYKAAPERGRLSDFLPHSPVEYSLATALRDARLEQLAAMRGEC